MWHDFCRSTYADSPELFSKAESFSKAGVLPNIAYGVIKHDVEGDQHTGVESSSNHQATTDTDNADPEYETVI